MAIVFPNTFEEDLNGFDNVSGLKQLIYLARKDWFQTIAKPANDLNSPAFDPLADFVGTVEIRDSHIFKVGFGFLPIYVTFDKNSYDAEMPKGNDQSGSIHIVKGFMPSIDLKKLALVRNCQNYKWIGLVETIDGKFLQIGQQDLWADFIAKFGTQTTTGDIRGSEFTLKAFQVHPTIYSGTITRHP